MAHPEPAQRQSRDLPLVSWTRRLVKLWMRFNATAILPRLLRVDRDLFVDLYLIFMILPLVGLLLLWKVCERVPWLSWLPVFGVVLAVWMIQEIVCVTLYDLLRDKPVRGRKRWMLATLPTVAHVILCFAILFLWLGDHFTPGIDNWLRAIYASVTTFSTLGYGDIRPVHGSRWGMALVICEQSLFLFVVVIRVPMAISMMRVRDVEDAGETGGGAAGGSE